MANKYLSVFILFIIFKVQATPLHKQFFLADGGFASVCTLSQSVSNPAGTFCGKDWTLATETIGTSTFGVTKMSSKRLDGDSSYEMDIDTSSRFNSSYAAVVQGYNYTDYRVGLFLVNQPGGFSLSLSKLNSTVKEITNAKIFSNTTQLGFFASSGSGNWMYGSSLIYIREEQNLLFRFKRRELVNNLDTQYNAELQSIYHFLVGNFGLIYKNDITIGLSVQPKMDVIQGEEAQSYAISGAPYTYEGSNSATIKTNQPWMGRLGLVVPVSMVFKYYLDLFLASESNWSRESQEKSVVSVNASDKKANQSIGLGFSYNYSSDVELINAIKYSHNELNSSLDSDGWTLTSGYIKTIKYIELGTGFYYQQTHKKQQEESNENLTINYGLVFSSSIKY